MKILFLLPYPTEGPSNRYRVEQYLPYLEAEGIDYSVRPFINSDFFKIIYKKGHNLKKMLYFLISAAMRLVDLINCYKYDLIFVHIESFPFGPAILEWFFSKLGKPIVYDFEDAVYLSDFRQGSKILNRLRYPHKFYQILRLSSQVIVCNNHMRDLVYPFNNNVTVIPTSIDTGKFKVKAPNPAYKPAVIGWIGSHTTAYCLNQLTDVFIELSKNHNFYLKIVGGGKDFNISGVKIINEEWTLEKDVENLQSLDIGIYPLPNDERAKAKTPFKTVQYMAVGIPAVVSTVGGNIDMIQDGVNGFLASSGEEWLTKLSLLIEKPELRRKIGLEGRRTAEERYSLEVNAPKFIDIIQKVYSERLSK